MSNFHTNSSGSGKDRFIASANESSSQSANSNGSNGSSPGRDSISTSASNGSNGSSAFVSRRDIRASNPTGALPAVGPNRNYTGYVGHPGSFDFEAMLVSLHELFEHDRQVASQQDGRRCGICYLHFTVSELHYREEDGLYVCPGCEKTLNKQHLPMIRRQQK